MGVAAEDEHLRFREHRHQKMLLRANLGSELVCRVHGRIDIPPKSFFSSLYRCDHICEGRFTNDQQIDVTGGVELTPRSRAEHERRVHTICEGHQCLTQNVHESSGLGEEALQLGKDCGLLVRLEVHLLAADLAAHEAGSGQLFQLALNRADGAACLPYQLAQVVRFVSMTEEPSEHTPSRAAEKKSRRINSRD